MNFLSPGGLFFLLSIPVILAFYILKRRRVEKRTSSTLLWERFLAETQANSPFQKLRRNALMILQMILAGFLALALARPFLAGEEKVHGMNVLIVDASGSMMSTDVEPSRFESARQIAGKIIGAMEPGAVATLIRMGPRTEIAQSTTSRKAELLAALEAMEVSTGTAAALEAFQLAESLVRNPSANSESEGAPALFPEATIHLISDGGLEGLEALATKNLPIQFHPVGTRNDNLAITSVDARSAPEAPETQLLFAQIENTSSNSINTVLTLSFDGGEIENRPVSIEGQSRSQVIFQVEQPRDGTYQFVLNHKDDLKIDNQAWITHRVPAATKVLLISDGNLFLQKALQSVKGVDLTTSTTWPADEDLKAFDILMADRIPPGGTPPTQSALWIQCAPAGWFESNGSMDGPLVTSMNPDHPILRFVSIDQLLVARSQKVNPTPWSSPLVQSTDSPLILEGETESSRHVWIGFDLLESNWPRLVSFPIFVANAVTWLSPASQQEEILNRVTGQPIQFKPLAQMESAQVVLPDGQKRQIKTDPESGQIYFSQTDEPGIYEFSYATNKVQVAVSALHRGESLTTPITSLSLGSVQQVVGSEIKNAQTEIWKWVIAGVLVIMALEWWYFHKRTA